MKPESRDAGMETNAPNEGADTVMEELRQRIKQSDAKIRMLRIMLVVLWLWMLALLTMCCLAVAETTG